MATAGVRAVVMLAGLLQLENSNFAVFCAGSLILSAVVLPGRAYAQEVCCNRASVPLQSGF